MRFDEAKLTPVKLNSRCVMGRDQLVKHMRLALCRNLPQIRRVPPHDGEAVLVGSGPSAEDYLGQIREHAKNPSHIIVALKAAHDFLLDHGIRPHIAIAVDPQEKIAKLYGNPQWDIRYYMASQCHPAVFEALKDHRVVLWHLYTKGCFDYWQEWLRKKKRHPEKMFFIGGGTTTGMRAMSLMSFMGYRKINLYGFDCSLRQNLLKITGESVPDEQILVVGHEGRGFLANGAMAQQSDDYYKNVKGISNLKVKAYGDGLIPWMTETAARRGDPQFLFPGEDWNRYGDPRRGSWPTLEEGIPQATAAA